MSKKIAPFIQSILLLTIVWCMFFGVTFFFSKTNEQIEFYVPESANIEATVDSEKLMSNIAFNTLIDQQKDGLNELLFQLLQEKKASNNKNLIAGIDFMNSVSFFTDEYNGQSIQGLIFKLNNSKLWDKNADKLIKKHSLTQRKGTSGLLVFSEKISKNELKKYVSQTDFSKPKPKLGQNDSFVKFNYHSDKYVPITNVSSSLNYNKHKISAQGKVVHSLALTKAEYRLEKNDFHISSALLPTELKDTLRYFAQQIGLETPNIHAISMNYSGIELTKGDNGILPLPLIDMILEFEEPFSIVGNLERLALSENILFNFNKSEMTLKLGNKTYYWQQLSPTSVYIGLTKQPKIIKNTSSEILNIEGNPTILLNIKGSKWVAGAIKMSPIYSTLENTFSEMKNVCFKASSVDKNKLNCDFQLQFNEDKKALNEVIKILLKQ